MHKHLHMHMHMSHAHGHVHVHMHMHIACCTLSNPDHDRYFLVIPRYLTPLPLFSPQYIYRWLYIYRFHPNIYVGSSRPWAACSLARATRRTRVGSTRRGPPRPARGRPLPSRWWGCRWRRRGWPSDAPPQPLTRGRRARARRPPARDGSGRRGGGDGRRKRNPAPGCARPRAALTYSQAGPGRARVVQKGRPIKYYATP